MSPQRNESILRNNTLFAIECTVTYTVSDQNKITDTKFLGEKNGVLILIVNTYFNNGINHMFFMFLLYFFGTYLFLRFYPAYGNIIFKQ